MFYNYKNCKVSLSGVSLLASDVKISSQSYLDPVFLSERKFSSSFVPTDNVATEVNISYFLTGKDFIKSLTNDEKITLSGNVGGLYFQSGYLSSYSIDVKPNQPVSAQIKIVVFDKMTGTFQPSTETPNNNIKVLNCSDVSINGFKIGDENNILSAGFSFKNEIKPHYSIKSETGLVNFSPDRVVFGQRSISSEIELDNLSGDLPIFGEKAALQLNFKDRDDGLIKESFSVSGTLESKNISIGGESFTRGTLSIKQESTEGLPTIIDFNPKVGGRRQKVEIVGTAFNTFPEVYFGGIFAPDVSYTNNSTLEVLVPTLLQEGSGLVCLFANDVFICSNDYFSILPNIIVVSGFAPSSGKIGSTVTGSGESFEFIDTVYLGNVKASFKKLDKLNTLSFTVPLQAQWNNVKVVSNSTNSFGESSSKFLPFPKIEAITPRTASSGQTVFISGQALNTVTGVYFNNKSAFIAGTGSGNLSVIVPTGDTTGPVKVVGLSGVNDTFTGFVTYANITGTEPTSGDPGDLVTIKGYDFYSGNLKRASDYSGDPSYNKILVSFNGGTGAFDIQNAYNLTGTVPSAAISGTVRLARNNILPGFHDSSVTFVVPPRKPTITVINPITGSPANRGKLGTTIHVTGTNLLSVTGLYVFPSGGLPTTNLLKSPLSTFFISYDNSHISFTVPSGSGSGLPTLSGINKVALESSRGRVTGNDPLFLRRDPVISGFSGDPNFSLLTEPLAEVRISGGEFYSGYTNVYFSGTYANSVPVLTAAEIKYIDFNLIKVTTPQFLQNGVNYYIVVDNGTSNAVSNQIHVRDVPEILGFSIYSGAADSSLTISGKNLCYFSGEFSGLYHGSVFSSAISGLSGSLPTGVKVKIPELTGYLIHDKFFENNISSIVLQNSYGTAISSASFETIPPAISGIVFDLSSVFSESNIIISGHNIFQVTGIKLSGSPVIPSYDANFLPADSYLKNRIKITIPTGALTGPINLLGKYHNFTTANSLIVFAFPEIDAVSPSLSGLHGEILTFSGKDLHSLNYHFGGIISGGTDDNTPFVEEGGGYILNKFSGTGPVSGLSMTYTKVGTGETVQIAIPHPLTKRPAIFFSSSAIQNPTGNDFHIIDGAPPIAPLPSIHGISHSQIGVGGTLYVSGYNLVNLNPNCLGISGTTPSGTGRIEFLSKFNTSDKDLNFFDLGEFFIPSEPSDLYKQDFSANSFNALEALNYNYLIYKKLIGSGVTDSRTGMQVIPIQVGDNFIGTGKVFFFFDEPAIYPTHGAGRLIGVDQDGKNVYFSGKTLPTKYEAQSSWYTGFTGSYTKQKFSGILSPQNLIVTPETISVSGFSPASGYTNSTISIIGTGLSNIHTAKLVDNSSVHHSLSVGETLYNKITVTIPSIATGIESGRIYLASNSASATTSQYFTILQPPTITGFSPIEGIENSFITIYGKNLEKTNSVKFKSRLNNQLFNFEVTGFGGLDANNNITITGLVPRIISVPHEFNILVESSSSLISGTERGTYTLQVSEVKVFGNFTVKNDLIVSGTGVFKGKGGIIIDSGSLNVF